LGTLGVETPTLNEPHPKFTSDFLLPIYSQLVPKQFQNGSKTDLFLGFRFILSLLTLIISHIDNFSKKNKFKSIEISST